MVAARFREAFVKPAWRRSQDRPCPLTMARTRVGNPGCKRLALREETPIYSYVRLVRAAFAAAAVAGFAAPSAPAATWVVDDDAMQCPNADFPSIQAAVDAAAANDTVAVCPGLYQETVDVPASDPNAV